MTSKRHLEEIARYRREITSVLIKADGLLEHLNYNRSYTEATVGGEHINNLDAAVNDARIFLDDTEPASPLNE